MEEASLSAGARQVHLIAEPVAAAIGAGVSIAEPVGRMIVDVGGGTSEVAVLSLGGIVVSRSVRVGGYDLDEAIGPHIRHAHRMAIGSQSTEAIKLEIGSAAPLTPEIEAEVRGRDLLSGLPRELRVGSAEVRRAIDGPLSEILAALEETPPELAGDIVRHGILLAGGGSLLRALAERVHAQTRDAGAPGRVTAHLRGGGRGARPRGARRSRAVKYVSHAGALVIAQCAAVDARPCGRQAPSPQARPE
jgi:rod shape-determining protein MreB and related proteins